MSKENLRTDEPGLRPPEAALETAETVIAPDRENLYNVAGEPVTVWYDSPSKTTRVLNLANGEEKELKGHRVKKQREKLLGFDQLDPQVRQGLTAGEDLAIDNGETETDETPTAPEKSNLPDWAELLGLRSLKRFVQNRREAVRRYYQSEEYFAKRSHRLLRRLERSIAWRRAYVGACHRMIKILDTSALKADSRINDMKVESDVIKNLLAEEESPDSNEEETPSNDETSTQDQEQPAAL